jgi:glycosyltransferase involved in cell wall biosynthesis
LVLSGPSLSAFAEDSVASTTNTHQRSPGQLNILHCLRAPVGGLFRHVLDLAVTQSAMGHRVGIVCASTGDSLTESRLLAVATALKLGLHRLPMGREIGLADVRAWRQIGALAAELDLDILHGHGAKGGAYARLAARTMRNNQPQLRCFYTPHGGSLHYPTTSMAGKFYRALERRLEGFTNGILFESQFAADRYSQQFGQPACAVKVVVNGLSEAEFKPVPPNADAADFIFVGELRMLKGVDVALDALAIVQDERPASAVFVGSGPDAAAFKEQARRLGLQDCVSFPGAMKARDAFALGRILLVPSRAESLPYVVLEGIAAEVPLIATNVGGIPEIVPHAFGPLLPPGDATALAAAMVRLMSDADAARKRAKALKFVVQQHFNVATMSHGVTQFYGSKEQQQKVA